MPLAYKKQAKFSVCLAEFILELRDLGYEVTLGEAYRPKALCELYAKQGIGISESNHEKRLAIDLNIFKGNTLLQTKAELEECGALWESKSCQDYTCSWGGCFLRFDGEHFSFVHDGIR